jgi:hypothetical protein
MEYETAIEVLESYLGLLEEKHRLNDVSSDYNSKNILDLSNNLGRQLYELSDLIKEELNNPINTDIKIYSIKGLSYSELKELERSISSMKGFKCSWISSNHPFTGCCDNHDTENEIYNIRIEGNYYKTQSKFIEDVADIINNLPIDCSIKIDVDDIY